ncbi:MAG: MMPL family transporter [Dehalococcoidales bacterium]|nr:MMPL family transporter [Dehalococcoidales bacterium]
MNLSNWTESLARACARRPWLTVGLWIGVMVLAIFSVITLLGGALVTDTKPTNNPESMIAMDLMNERLGIDTSTVIDEMIIVRSSTFTVDDPEFQNVVDNIYADVSVLGPDVFLGGATYYMTQDPSLVSADRHATLFLFNMPFEADERVNEIYAIGDKYADEVFEVYHTGTAAWAADAMKLGEEAASKGEAIGVSAALIILAIVFGAIAAALLPVALGVVAIIVALGLTGLVGQAMDLTFFVTNMITMMGLAVGIDYSLFILTRFREERQRGLSKMDAIGTAGATANRAVFYSGLTVVLALSGLVMFPLTIFISMGIGSILVVVTAIIASLTLLPALLSLMGDKVNAIRIPFIQRKKDTMSYEKPVGFWAWITRVVTKVPAVSVILAVVILLLAAYPFLDKKSGMSGINDVPDYLRSKQGYVVLQNEFHVSIDRPVTIVIDGDINSAETQSGIMLLQEQLAAESAFVGSQVVPYPEQNLAIVYARLTGDPMSQASMDAVRMMRSDYIPPAFDDAPVHVLVTGDSAFMVDFNQTTSDYTPIIFAYVLALSFVILILAFRSIVISITAIIMNLLSVGAAYGLIVLVFQKGVGAGLFGFMQVEAIETWLPLFLFAILFGLSMDYHVFLLSRMRERFMQKKDNSEAVSFGLRSTGRLITGAALIMVAVFMGFALGDLVMMQQMGFGLAVAVFLDATLVRCVLVPATMKLLGKYNWYLPRWLEWIPNISLGDGLHKSDTAKTKVEKKPVPDIDKPIPVEEED